MRKYKNSRQYSFRRKKTKIIIILHNQNDSWMIDNAEALLKFHLRSRI